MDKTTSGHDHAAVAAVLGQFEAFGLTPLTSPCFVSDPSAEQTLCKDAAFEFPQIPEISPTTKRYGLRSRDGALFWFSSGSIRFNRSTVSPLRAAPPGGAVIRVDTPELPHCDRALGTAAIQEPDRNWWAPLGLSDPESLLKLFASRSGCLRIIDRNGGLAMHAGKDELAQSGELRRGSNVGRGQVAAADFFIIPDIANSNENSIGNGLGAAGESFLPGGFGLLAGSIRTKRSEAHTLITLVNARTTEQLYVAEGTSQKTDSLSGAGAIDGGPGKSGGFARGGYSESDVGKVVTAAYFNAFTDLVHYMQSNAAPELGSTSASSGIQAYTVQSRITLRSRPGAQAKAVRSFNAGDIVYPTGQKNRTWWEVDDDEGNRGWVTSTAIRPR